MSLVQPRLFAHLAVDGIHVITGLSKEQTNRNYDKHA